MKEPEGRGGGETRGSRQTESGVKKRDRTNLKEEEDVRGMNCCCSGVPPGKG